MRRRFQRAVAPVLSAGALGLAAACADSPTGPGAATPARGPALSSASTSATVTTGGMNGLSSSIVVSSGISSSSSSSKSSVSLSISPTTTATFTIGNHKVKIVAGSICDPATSGYGATLWDAACTPAKSTVMVTATSWTGSDGHPVVTFSPDLRFVPGKVNTIWLLDKTAAAQHHGVLAWCPTGGAVCVDESATDASLATQYDANGYAYRRLKHFSGYTVVAY